MPLFIGGLLLCASISTVPAQEKQCHNKEQYEYVFWA